MKRYIIISILLILMVMLYSCVPEGQEVIPTDPAMDIPTSIAEKTEISKGETEWIGMRLVMTVFRHLCITINDLLNGVADSEIEPGTQIEINVTGYSTSKMKIKLSSISEGDYQYFLEIWGEDNANPGTYIKGIEFKFKDEKKGQFIVRPWVFLSDYYDENHYGKAIFNHTDTKEVMDVYVVRTETDMAKRQIYRAEKENGLISVYFTGMMDQDYGGDPENDIYLLGVLINEDSPNETIAKYGIIDESEAVDFVTWGGVITNPNNAGEFYRDTETGDGVFNRDGVADGDQTTGYPDPTNIDKANLPSKTDTDSVTVSFESTDEPDF
jgi:hypothetical protein